MYSPFCLPPLWDDAIAKDMLQDYEFTVFKTAAALVPLQWIKGLQDPEACSRVLWPCSYKRLKKLYTFAKIETV